MLISTAYAQTAATTPGAGFDFLIPLVLVGLVMYFLMIRPQQKKAREHRELLSRLNKGDKVMLSSGFIGTISKAPQEGEEEIEVEIAADVRVKVVRQAVANVLDSKEKRAAAAATAAKEKARGKKTKETEKKSLADLKKDNEPKDTDSAEKEATSSDEPVTEKTTEAAKEETK